VTVVKLLAVVAVLDTSPGELAFVCSPLSRAFATSFISNRRQQVRENVRVARRPVDGGYGNVVNGVASQNKDVNDDQKHLTTSDGQQRRPRYRCVALPDVTAYCNPCASTMTYKMTPSTDAIFDTRKDDVPIHDVIEGDNHRKHGRPVTSLCDDFAVNDFDAESAVQALHKAAKYVRRKIVVGQ